MLEAVAEQFSGARYVAIKPFGSTRKGLMEMSVTFEDTLYALVSCLGFVCFPEFLLNSVLCKKRVSVHELGGRWGL